MVYHLDRSENALVDPWAITTTTGLSEQWFDNTYVKCGTKNSCKWKCVRDQNNEYQCVESETTFDWNLSLPKLMAQIVPDQNFPKLSCFELWS